MAIVKEKLQEPPIEEIAASNMELLRTNSYPGRGIVMGINKEGNQAVQVYWIMGRSENSRNRILVREGDIVKTEPFDRSKVSDPSLIIYTAMRVVSEKHLVSNGNQTDSIAEVVQNGGTFEEGLLMITYEPDAPNFTPRISGEYSPGSENPFLFSLIRKDPSSATDPRRNLHLSKPRAGIGLCIHTYKGDGSPLPSFDSAPYPVILEGTIDQITQRYWSILDPQNKVALVVKGIDTTTGKISYSIINKLGS